MARRTRPAQGGEIDMTERETKQLEKIYEKLAYMKDKQQAILARERKRLKKERTRHLIKCGELSEKYFGFENIHPVEWKKFLKKLFDVPDVKDYIEHIKKSLL